ncbi:Hsp20/alpha crystallin family protein [uncultured Alistipes sp.]|uniref:Hsp20/alpha crystallin family protein n=1 Tax=uncultured Alistipes sp. TaxID=538949 RepID=UPI0025CC2561|nr:Hsp20/alpha crystallin family protein [uncultured Alistipes sp.]
MMPVKRSQNWLPSIFNDFFGNEWVEKSGKTAPAVNIFETDTEYKVEYAAPGLTKDDFNIHVRNDNEMVISMEKKQEHTEKDKKGTCLRREFSYNQFQQSMILPENAEMDKIEARVKNGVLTIQIPKKAVKENAETSRKVEVY